MYQKSSEEIKRVHATLTNGVNPLEGGGPFHGDVLGMKYQDKTQQIRSDAVEPGIGDPMNTIHAIQGLLYKSDTEMEDHRRKFPGPRQTTRTADILDAHARSLKHRLGSVNELQEALATGYEMSVRVAHLNMLRTYRTSG
jgi:uncharacterized protein YukE